VAGGALATGRTSTPLNTALSLLSSWWRQPLGDVRRQWQSRQGGRVVLGVTEALTAVRISRPASGCGTPFTSSSRAGLIVGLLGTNWFDKVSIIGGSSHACRA
jgi:hypothetical protein